MRRGLQVDIDVGYQKSPSESNSKTNQTISRLECCVGYRIQSRVDSVLEIFFNPEQVKKDMKPGLGGPARVGESSLCWGGPTWVDE